jgi:hypothetical protein
MIQGFIYGPICIFAGCALLGYLLFRDNEFKTQLARHRRSTIKEFLRVGKIPKTENRNAMAPVCPGNDCPKKYSCSRFRAEIDRKTENYLASAPFKVINGQFKCGWFIGSTPEWMAINRILNGKADR